ncbi:TetR/AcrR family transcriptional regulator [Mameliella sediminis]|uniref:TetR/AcrR family transcriptional regulator n=1 Tax=Mameliella sediminis TaxID=2836866 RepID=UPI001C48BC6E|nr:TetR/AcrR family transcriptional regulator [Mameliella sediminis]MBV7395907.1 TetR/AcrR family transcriptional regulator [Mameliella sediminis]MBY6160319.1 TetR/AcrR family transcriptional regulator [Mameliella alba]MBY6168789.1 TetR/AcrR family transcriptional regulator [Mameliella alba]MBY6173990.1 TetR/AcrR family transcriptional regulator [Mameliella alba]
MAGRPRSIDRNKVLDAAEALVLDSGAGALSFDAVAKAAGVTKGGVQYAFGTRDNLIRAMITRWGEAFDADVAKRTGPEPSPRQRIQGHLSASRDADAAEHSRSAVMMTALVQHPDQLADTRDWYNTRLAGLDLSKPEDRKLALAFLAGEGAFLLKAFGLMDIGDADWKALFADMLAATSVAEDKPESED